MMTTETIKIQTGTPEQLVYVQFHNLDDWELHPNGYQSAQVSDAGAEGLRLVIEDYLDAATGDRVEVENEDGETIAVFEYTRPDRLDEPDEDGYWPADSEDLPTPREAAQDSDNWEEK